MLGKALIEELQDVFGLLGDKTRLRIVLSLAEGPRNVGKLCEDLGLAQPTVSHHLSLLRRGKLISNSRKGKEVHYSINADFFDRVFEDVFAQAAAGRPEIKMGRYSLKRGPKPR
jgi:DNA-binding transcriptional ArsR family regulator